MPLLKQIINTRVKTNKMTSLNMVTSLFIACCFISVSSNAETTKLIDSLSHTEQLARLKVTPKPCVALRKGQKCYLEVTFSWHHPNISNYCLVNSTTNKTIKCWQQQAKGQVSFDFQSKLTNDFALRKQASSVDLARAQIPVAWVYKSSKRAKSTWRLF
ncbi:MAG: DUF3019 domain-containing protein [Colwellia sp.]|nr:DUF3019 domain-containing protein [Colwellia sp.]